MSNCTGTTAAAASVHTPTTNVVQFRPRPSSLARAWLASVDLTPHALRVGKAIAEHASIAARPTKWRKILRGDIEAHVSAQTLARDLGLSRQHVHRALRELIEAGLDRRRTARSNTYVFPAEVAAQPAPPRVRPRVIATPDATVGATVGATVDETPKEPSGIHDQDPREEPRGGTERRAARSLKPTLPQRLLALDLMMETCQDRYGNDEEWEATKRQILHGQWTDVDGELHQMGDLEWREDVNRTICDCKAEISFMKDKEQAARAARWNR